MSLKRNLNGLTAKPIFYNKFNDVVIYIEDTDVSSEKFYLIIFKTVLGEHCKIEKIFHLGGKNNVIKEFNKNKTYKKPALFIVDGDLKLFYNEPYCKKNDSTMSYLCYLNRYCIENYLIEEEVVVKALEEEDAVKKLEEIRGELDFNNWLENNKYLINLYHYYSIIKKNKLSIKNVSCRIISFDNKPGIIDKNKVKKKIQSIKKEIIQCNISEATIKTTLESISAKKDILIYVSGKELIYSLFRYIKAKQTMSFPKKEVLFIQKLARQCQFDDLKLLLKPFIETIS